MVELKENLQDFVGSRLLRPELKEYFVDEIREVEGTVYRGLPFPLHLLKVGGQVEDWHGSGHWTLDMTTAKAFSKDYVNEDYMYELIEERGEANVEFVKVILTCDNIKGIELYKLLEEHSIQGFDAELEITTIDSRYIISSVKEDGIYYYVNVKQVQ